MSAQSNVLNDVVFDKKLPDEFIPVYFHLGNIPWRGEQQEKKDLYGENSLVNVKEGCRTEPEKGHKNR